MWARYYVDGIRNLGHCRRCGTQHLGIKLFLGYPNMKKFLTIFLLTISCNSMAEWIEYSTMPNGDVYFYDSARVEKNGNHISVWTRIRYKRSVMAASSYQSFLRLDCSDNSETALQSTFYTDKDWIKPAMATNTNPKPKQVIKPNSASERLVNTLCKD